MPRLAIVLGHAADLGRRRTCCSISLAGAASRGSNAVSPRATAAERRRRHGAKKRRRCGSSMSTALTLLKKARGTARLPLRAAVVRHHRPAGRRQDDGAAEQRAEVPAGRRDGPGRGGRCRRHAALRLVVHRERRADRHRRPLHHAGFRMQRSIAPGWDAFLDLLQPDPAAPAAERRHRRDRAQRHRRRAAAQERLAHARAIRRRIKELEEPPGIRMPVYALLHQGRSDRRASPSSSTTSTASGAARSGASPSRWPRREAGTGRAVPGRVAAPGRPPRTSACSIACRPSSSPERRALIAGFPTQIATPRAAACRASSSRPSAAPGSIRRPCCAASISPRAPRKARRSTA